MTERIINSNITYESFEKKWFIFLAIYFLIVFARIHEIANIGFLKPGMIITIVLALFFFISNRKDVIYSKQIIFIILFILLLFVYIPFAANTYYAFHAAWVMLLMVPCLLSIVILIHSRERINKILWLFVFLAAFNAGHAFLHGGRGQSGVIADENDLALFLVTMLPFAFFLLSQNLGKFKKIILVSVISLCILAVVVTWSRGGFVGLLAMLAVFFWFSKHKAKILIYIVILISILFIYGGEEYVDRISEITTPGEGTAGERIHSWIAGWRMFLHNPFGVGGGNFSIHFPEYQTEFHSRSMWGRAVHSLWFTLIPETGIIGILIFSSLIITNFKYIFYIRKLNFSNSENNITETDTYYFNLSTALLASLVGFSASATFLSVLYYPHFWILTALILAIRNLGVIELQSSGKSY